MKNNEYESVEQMDADLNLMFENAKRYNVSSSHIYKRALKLQHILQVLSLIFSFECKMSAVSLGSTSAITLVYV